MTGVICVFPAWAGDTALTVARGTEVVANWEPTQHAYVKGNVGVGADQLQGLEQWMDQYARNWTAVLLEDAGGETFSDGGNRYSGMDAVDHALGKGLPNKTVFDQFVDERTGQRNGAFFVLYLNERKFGYYASDVFDRRRLGEDRWQGNLDAPAIAAMRSGGRVIDAVKDTITNIETKLTAAIKAEHRARERAVAEENQNRERAKQAIHDVEKEVIVLEQRVARARSGLASPDGANGDLTMPPVDRWRGELGLAANSLADGHATAASARVGEARKAITKFQRELDRHLDDGRVLDRMTRRLAAMAPHSESIEAPAQREKARENLARARDTHARMDSGYQGALAATDAAMGAFDDANAAAELTVKRRDARRRMQRRVAGGSAAGGVIALLGLGTAGNRRRRKIKQEAEDLCDAWETGLREKTDGLFELLDRAAVVVGSASNLEIRGYAGETLRLSRQTIKDVDELFIMASCADGVLEQAQELTRPDGVTGKSVNIVAGNRYAKALKLLKEDAIRFQPKDGLEHIMRGSRGDRESLLGEVKTYGQFSMSFDDLIAAFNERAARALASLDSIENAWAAIVPDMDAVAVILRDAEAREIEVDGACAGDGWFALASVFEKLLPSAREDHVAAVNLGGADPVAALRTSGAEARRKASEALALTGAVMSFRGAKLAGIQGVERELGEKDYAVAWIGVLLDEFSDQADQLASDAVSGSTTEEMEKLAGELAAFAQRVDQARVAALRLEGESTNAIEETSTTIAGARGDLAMALSIEPETLFHESDDLNPARYVERAKVSLAAARAALDRGAVSAADVSLNEVQALTDDARWIVSSTREAHAAHPETFAKREEETERLDGFVSWHMEVLSRLRSRYASSALRIAAADPARGNLEDTIEAHIDEAAAMIESCREWQSLADAHFRAGRILTAADVLRDIEDEHGDIARRFTEIVRQEEELKKAEEANAASVTKHAKFAKSLRSAMSDPKVGQGTIDGFAAAEALAARAREAVDAPHGVADPFATRLLLSELGTTLEHIEDRVQSNRKSFAEADRSAASARRQIEENRALARRADRDKIPDSPATKEARAATEQLAQDLKRMELQMKESHHDWLKIDAEADRIDADGARWAARLREELERARQSVAMMQQASAAVRGATDWTGSHGVSITGSPGYDNVERARQFLLVGNYLAARQAAGEARRAAEQAVAAARALVAKRRREEEARQEAERRRRRARKQAKAARRRRSRSSSSGFGSRSSGGSFSSSRSSGSRRSSFSSGSGVSRSGW